MCEVVTKPFKPKLLTNLLVKLIGEYDLRRERDGVEKVAFCLKTNIYPITSNQHDGVRRAHYT